MSNEINAYRQIQDEDVRLTSVIVGDTTENTVPNFPVKVEVDLMIFNAQEKYEIIKENAPSVSFMKNTMREALNNPARKLPLLNFQSAERKLIPQSKKDKILKIISPKRSDGYKNAFTGVPNFSEIEEWCAQMDYSEYQLKHEVREYKNFKAIVSKFMKEITECEKTPRLEYVATIDQLVFYNDKESEPINIKSAGYQNVLCIIMDIARRAVLLNPTMDNFDELEGVVIIDEIDMHLHPKWQWKILDALHTTFPKVQFIVATHSPIIISSANKEAKLIKMISPNEIEYLASAYGYNISDVVEFRQGSTELPQKAKDLKKELENSIDEEDFEKAGQLIQKAIEIFGENSSPVREMKDFFEVSRWVEEAE